MHTLGYRFKPWTAAKAIADGPSILEYMRETAARRHRPAHPLRPPRRRAPSGRRPTRAGPSTSSARTPARRLQMTCGFLVRVRRLLPLRRGLHCPEFPGSDRFEGTVIHPQHWPEDLDYAGKRVVVIGSGATAVTLVPAMAGDAAHVTMLQRSPTYIVVAARRRTRSPTGCAASCPTTPPTRSRAGRTSSLAAAVLPAQPPLPAARCAAAPPRRHARSCPRGYDVDTHFNPRYDPWDQRLCLVPDGDLFKALGAGHRRRSSPTRSRRSPRRASGCARATSSRPTSSSPRPA